MKRLFTILITLTLLLGLTACGQVETQSNPGQSQTQQEGTSSKEESSTPNQSTPPAFSTPEAGESDVETPEDGVLVAYFSATGNTEGIAQHLQAVLGADLYEIIPAEPYSDDDLNYNASDCRANQEQNDPDARPAIDGSVDNMEDYEVIFLGYPIWWGDAPKIISTFLESYDFDGKTIVPFCTSGSSGIGNSVEPLADLADSAVWREGTRFAPGASQEEVAAWVDGLGL